MTTTEGTTNPENDDEDTTTEPATLDGNGPALVVIRAGDPEDTDLHTERSHTVHDETVTESEDVVAADDDEDGA